MRTTEAFARGEASRTKELMVFDWDKAAELIRDRKPNVARAGLAADWEWTGGDIYRAGQPVAVDDTYVYLASTWATPELEMDDTVVACFKMQSQTPNWDASTYWPESARSILAEPQP